jgi:hypothetical protein
MGWVSQLGDLCDFGIISSHNLGNLREVEGGRLLEEYKVADEIVSRHEQIIRKNNQKARMIYLEGNHEYRIERYINAHPELQGMIEVENVLRLKQRHIEYVHSWSRGEIFRLGKCAIHHGLYCTDNHAKKMVQRFGTSVLYGHVHDYQVYSSHSIDPANVLVGASLGCLCKIPQKYLRGAPTRWSQGITIFEHDETSGDFWFQFLKINKGRLVHDGRVYQA